MADAETAAFSDRRQLTELVVSGLARLVPCELALVTDSDARAGQTTTTATDPRLSAPRRRDPAFWLACLEDHPTVAHYERTGEGRALRFSDLVSRRAYQRTPLYQHFLRPFGVEYKLDVRIRPRPGHMDIGCCRERRDFDDDERAVLDRLRPYLFAVFRRADAGTAASDLRDAFGLTRREAEVLALVVGGLTNHDIAATLFLSAGTVRKHLERVYAKLGVATRTQAISRALQARLAPSISGAVAADMIRRLGTIERPRVYRLTVRETEVLALTSSGSSNREIAATLRIAPETVKKHLDHVYAKLGVTSRSQAAGRALTLGLVQSPPT